jgi:hypothetical protein
MPTGKAKYNDGKDYETNGKIAKIRVYNKGPWWVKMVTRDEPNYPISLHEFSNEYKAKQFYNFLVKGLN